MLNFHSTLPRVTRTWWRYKPDSFPCEQNVKENEQLRNALYKKKGHLNNTIFTTFLVDFC